MDSPRCSPPALTPSASAIDSGGHPPVPHRLVDPPRTWAAPEISSRSPGLPEEFTGPLGKSVLVGSVRTLVRITQSWESGTVSVTVTFHTLSAILTFSLLRSNSRLCSPRTTAGKLEI